MKFPNVRVCDYCDIVFTCDGWASSVGGRAALLCSYQCKSLYEKAIVKQGEFRWDVT